MSETPTPEPAAEPQRVVTPAELLDQVIHHIEHGAHDLDLLHLNALMHHLTSARRILS